MDWNKLKVFYHVAKAGSFMRAGENLNLAQSTLSVTIQILEHSLKTQPFNRIPRGVVLTKQGVLLFDKVEKMFAHVEEAKALIQTETLEPQGSLKVATTVALASLWLVELIPGFLEQYPGIELDIIGDDERLDVKSREADVSIHSFPLHQEDVIQTYLFSCFLKLYASPSYLKTFGTPETPEDLDNHRIITFGDSTIRPYLDVDWPLRIGGQRGRIRKSYININSSKGASRLAELGMGIVALSKEFPGINTMNLVEVLPQVSGPIIDLYYIYPKSLKNSKRVQVFKEYLLKLIPDHFKRTIQ